MPDDKQVSTPDVPWQDLSYKFDGQWLPDVDSTLIGPDNYQTLQNLRYIEGGIEAVSGYTKVNPNAIGATTKIATGHQLVSNKTQTSYTLAQGVLAATGQGTVYCNRVAPGTVSTTDFDHQTGGTAYKLDTSGHEYRTDASVNLQGRFSDAPQGNLTYCNSEESTIFGGDEQPVAACFSIETDTATELMPNQVDRDFSGASAWANSGVNPLVSFDETDDLSISGTYNDWCGLSIASAPTTIGKQYTLSFDLIAFTNSGGTFTPIVIYDNVGTQIIGVIDKDMATGTGKSFSFTAATTGGLRIATFDAGGTTATFDNFSLKLLEPISQLDVTDNISNTLRITEEPDTFFWWKATENNMVYVFTTRPIQAVKFYISNVNTTVSSLSGFCSTGSSSWESISLTDGTETGGDTALGQTGVVSFTHTQSKAKPFHFEELYLYAYSFVLSAGSAVIYHITVDPAMQKIVDVWDGVYRQPIQFQILDTVKDNYFDYTLQVQESSDLNAPVGAILDALSTTDRIYIMFEDQASAIKFTMLGDLVNEIGAESSFLVATYWDGSDWLPLPITDGTQDDNNVACFAQSGLVSWTPPTNEEPQTLFSSFGYVYKFQVSYVLKGTKDDTAELVVDICTGVPAQLTVPVFDWSAMYGSRLMLGSHSKGDEGNRMDYSVANGPDVWNGFDSSDGGKQSLYYGGNEKIVAGTQIYNRFGANVYAMLLVLKQSEVYILVGDTPEEFTIYPVAKTIGCVAPLSLATAEIGIDLGGGLTRNIAMWLSHSGPVMFDGAVLVPINGISSYFDPTDSKFVKFSLISKAVGWFDAVHKEYNICIPSGSAATTNNVWLVFDLAKRKWYEKVCAASHFPQCGFDVISPSTGQKYNYGGKSDGFMVQLETGTDWNDGVDTGITQSVTTGDFYPSNNMWDQVTIRKHKLLVKKVTEVSEVTNTATIKHYLDTTTSSSTVGTVDLSAATGNQKLVTVKDDMNKTGVQHAFNYSVTTTNVDKGLQPIAWGIQFRPERKDNTTT